MKHQFYAPLECISGDTIVFPSDESHHAIRVLRVKTGDEAAVVDGRGGWYRTELEVVGRKNLVGRIWDRKQNVGEPAFELSLCVSVLKNASRFEWIVEKASELGVTRLIPIVSKRTERTRLKTTRLATICVSAMKQCGRSRLLHLDEPQKFRKLMKSSRDDGALRLICHESAPIESTLAKRIPPPGSTGRIQLFIGPEGGFTDEEIELASRYGCDVVTLGERRLRTETAAVCAASLIMVGMG